MDLKELLKKHRENLYVMLVLVSAVLAFVLIAGYWFRFSNRLDAGEISSREAFRQFSVISMIVTLGLIVFLLALQNRMKISRIERTQDWLIDATNWNIERLKAHGLCRLPDDTDRNGLVPVVSRWPWGSHHTELLGHLDAAARRFWTLYDPDDPSTAPTNDMVSEWLQQERRVSKEKAKAIASILRPDGLATGPRR